MPSLLIMCEGTAYLDRGSAPHAVPCHAVPCHATGTTEFGILDSIDLCRALVGVALAWLEWGRGPWPGRSVRAGELSARNRHRGH